MRIKIIEYVSQTILIDNLPISVGRDTTAGPGLDASAAIGPRRLVGVQGFWRTPIDASVHG